MKNKRPPRSTRRPGESRDPSAFAKATADKGSPSLGWLARRSLGEGGIPAFAGMTGGAIIFLFIYFLATYHKLFLQGLIPFDASTFRVVFPTWMVGKNLLIDGPSFLWDPYRNLGLPFLASPPNQALYPLRFFSIFLNFLDYQRLYVLFHIGLLSIFSFLLMRPYTKNWPGLVFAVIAFSFNGMVFSRLTTNIDFAALAWVPAVLYAIQQKRVVLLGVLLSLQWLAGFPTFSILTLLLCLIFALINKDRKKSLLDLTKSGFIFLGLSSIQMIPFLEMLKNSARPLILTGEKAFEYPLQLTELFRGLLVPSFILKDLAPPENWDPAVSGFYLGPLFVGLFIYGWLKNKKIGLLVGTTSLVGFLLALGPNNGFYSYIPLIKIFRFPAQWLLIGVFGMAFLGCLGFLKIKNQKFQLGLLFFIAADFFIFSLTSTKGWTDINFFQNASKNLSVVRNIEPQNRVFHATIISQNQYNWQLNDEQDWLSMFKMDVPSIPSSRKIKEVVSQHQLLGKKQNQFIQRLSNEPISSPLFDYAGIQTTVSLNKAFDRKNYPKEKDIVVINNPDPKPHGFMLNNQPSKILKDEPGYFTIEATGPGQLIFSDTFYPGWKAKINNQPTQINLFEDVFMSVQVPEGTHTIKFSYLPFSFLIGLFISILTCLFLFFLQKIYK